MRKIVISLQQYDRSPQNLARCVSQTVLAFEKFSFKSSKWRTDDDDKLDKQDG